MRPILFHIGSVPIRSFGMLVMIGFMAGLWWVMRECESRKSLPEGTPRRVAPEVLQDIATIGLFTSIIGARLVFVLLSWGYYSKHPKEIVQVWEGGISLHGALLFAVITLVVYCKKQKVSVASAADLGATAWALSYTFGRIGCFLNGCCYGNSCSLPWAVRFHDENGFGLTPPSHPIQIYAAILNLIFFLILVRWGRRPHHDGVIFLSYMIMYGAYRFFMEYLRIGATTTLLIPSLHLTDTHIVSLLMIVVSAIAMIRLQKTAKAY